MAIQFHPLPLEVFPEAARPHIKRLNVELRDLFSLEGAIRNPLQASRSDASIARRNEFQVAVTRITPSISEVVSGVSTVVGTPALVFGTVNTVGTTTSAVSVNSAVALFGTQPPMNLSDTSAVGTSAYAARADHIHDAFDTTVPAALGSAAATGSVDYAARRDHVHLFPPTLRSTANASTLTLTDDATDQTLTGSLGQLNVRTAADTLSFPAWIGGGKENATVGTVLGFLATSANLGNSLRQGVDSRISLTDSSTYASQTFKSINAQVAVQDTSGATFTSCTVLVADLRQGAGTINTNTHTFTERTVLNIVPAVMTQSGAGVLTVTDYYGIKLNSWTTTGTPGTVTNARSMLCQMPMVGGTIRRGLHISSTTGAFNNMGTESANAEGAYVSALTRGTTQRTSYYSEGMSGLAPDSVYAFYQGTAHSVGTFRYGARFTGTATGTPTAAYGVYVDSHGVGTNRWAIWGSNKFECSASDFICGTSQKGLVNRDGQGTARYWRTYVDNTGGTTGSVTYAVDASGVLTVTRATGATATINLQIADIGTAAPTT